MHNNSKKSVRNSSYITSITFTQAHQIKIFSKHYHWSVGQCFHEMIEQIKLRSSRWIGQIQITIEHNSPHDQLKKRIASREMLKREAIQTILSPFIIATKNWVSSPKKWVSSARSIQNSQVTNTPNKSYTRSSTLTKCTHQIIRTVHRR